MDTASATTNSKKDSKKTGGISPATRVMKFGTGLLIPYGEICGYIESGVAGKDPDPEKKTIFTKKRCVMVAQMKPVSTGISASSTIVNIQAVRADDGQVFSIGEFTKNDKLRCICRQQGVAAIETPWGARYFPKKADEAIIS